MFTQSYIYIVYSYTILKPTITPTHPSPYPFQEPISRYKSTIFTSQNNKSRLDYSSPKCTALERLSKLQYSSTVC